jgi:hypothetical protein
MQTVISLQSMREGVTVLDLDIHRSLIFK